jgi:hypothetical protein
VVKRQIDLKGLCGDRAILLAGLNTDASWGFPGGPGMAGRSSNTFGKIDARLSKRITPE